MKISKYNFFSLCLLGVLVLCFSVITHAYSSGMGPDRKTGLVYQKQEKKKSKKDQEPQSQKKIGNTALLINAKKEALIGNTTAAQEMFRRYIDRYPQDPVGYFESARIEAIQKNFSEAVSLTRQAVSLDPGNIWYTLFLAELCQMTGNLADAVTIYEKVAEENPGNLDYF